MLKAYHCTDDDLYAAESAEQAAELCMDMCGEPCEEGYPQELTDAELDFRYQAFDDNENPIEGETTSIREMLKERGSEPGWLAARL